MQPNSRVKIVGKVKGKMRPRFSRVNGRMYTPRTQQEYEELITAEYKRQGGRKYSGAVRVLIVIFRQLPKSAPKKIESDADLMKPDVDNVAKSVLDALNGVAYDDDAQVVALDVLKAPRARNPEGDDVMYVEVGQAPEATEKLLQAVQNSVNRCEKSRAISRS